MPGPKSFSAARNPKSRPAVAALEQATRPALSRISRGPSSSESLASAVAGAQGWQTAMAAKGGGGRADSRPGVQRAARVQLRLPPFNFFRNFYNKSISLEI